MINIYVEYQQLRQAESQFQIHYIVQMQDPNQRTKIVLANMIIMEAIQTIGVRRWGWLYTGKYDHHGSGESLSVRNEQRHQATCAELLKVSLYVCISNQQLVHQQGTK